MRVRALAVGVAVFVISLPSPPRRRSCRSGRSRSPGPFGSELPRDLRGELRRIGGRLVQVQRASRLGHRIRLCRRRRVGHRSRAICIRSSSAVGPSLSCCSTSSISDRSTSAWGREPASTASKKPGRPSISPIRGRRSHRGTCWRSRSRSSRRLSLFCSLNYEPIHKIATSPIAFDVKLGGAQAVGGLSFRIF